MPAFNPTKSQLRYQLTFEGEWPTAVAFLGSSNRLAAGNQAGQVYVWNLPDTPPPLERVCELGFCRCEASAHEGDHADVYQCLA
jgi:hypothetical protein